MGDSAQRLILSNYVLTHFERHRQSVSDSKEAGGQLFARIDGSCIIVEHATGPRPSDWKSKFLFIPNRIAERREIKRLFREGFHYVGDWHTHPDSNPKPSRTDTRTFRDIFRRSRHQLAGFVMVIVGTAAPPEGLFVAISDGETLHGLKLIRHGKHFMVLCRKT